MAEKQSAEEEKRRIKEAEKLEEYEDRRSQFYGTPDKKGGARKRPRIFLFGPNDLDNEEIISLVEQTPTFKRSKEMLNEIKSKSDDATPFVLNPETGTTQSAAPSIISF